jgi:hypothetical protein
MIAKWWRMLFGGCEHKWVTVESGKIKQGTRTRNYYDLRCEHCGNMKEVVL